MGWAVTFVSACATQANPDSREPPQIRARSPIALHQLHIMEASLVQLAAVGGSQRASQLVGGNLNAKLLR